MAWKNMSYKKSFGALSKMYPEYYPTNPGGIREQELSYRVQTFHNIPQMMPKVPLIGALIEAVRTDTRKIMLRVRNYSDHSSYGNTTCIFLVYDIVIMSLDSTTLYENSNYFFTVKYNISTDTEYYDQTKVGMSVMFDDEQELLCIIPLCEYRGNFSVIPYKRVSSEAYMTPNADFYNIAHQAYLAMGDIQEFDEDPYAIGGTSSIGGGNGELDITSDVISIPDLPSASAVGSGFVQIYTPSTNQLSALASFLWSDNFLDSLVKLKNDPFDIIVSLSLMPFPITSSGTRNLKAGNVDTLISMNVASSQFVDVDCGTFEIKPFYDAYLDFDPFTKCELFLPYHGVQELSLDDVMGKTVGIKYRVDILTGSYICYVTLDGSVYYTFTGTCGLEIPITGQDYSALYSSLINLATSAAVAGVAGAPVMSGGGEAAAAARVGYLSGQGANAVSTGISALTMKPTISRSGSLSANIGALGPQKPYLIFKVPRVSLPKNSMKLTGYPLNATAKLSDLKGYTQVQDIRFSGMSCTERELSEIDTILKAGIYIEETAITPVTTAHTLTLYHNASQPATLGKTLTVIDTVTGEFRENQQLSDVVVTLNRSSFSDQIPNYIYIADLHRFYYVEDVTIINSELVALTCHVDLLQSFATEILQQTAVISKQENNWNLYLNDGTFKCYQNPYVIQKVFPSGFNTTAMTYVLTVTGGGE